MNYSNFKSKRLGIILYDEWDGVRALIDSISQEFKTAWIFHDSDEGSKPHYHLILEAPNQVWNTSISKRFGIPINLIERIGSYEGALLYLIHYNNPDKFQYTIDSVHGSLKDDFLKVLNRENEPSESEKVLKMIDWIYEQEGKIMISSFVQWTASNSLYDVFRRSAVIFIKCIDEHNRLV